MFESLFDYVSGSSWTYAFLFAVAALDVVFPVVPSEASVITAGVLAASGDLIIVLVIAAAAAGAWLGDNGSYLIGRTLGNRAARRFFRGEKAQRRLQWAERLLRTRGAYLIVVSRFIPGGRTATTFTAGLVRYPWPQRFLPLTILATLIWASYAALIGYLGGSVFEEKPLYALLLAFGIAVTITVVVEGYRRLRHA